MLHNTSPLVRSQYLHSEEDLKDIRWVGALAARLRKTPHALWEQDHADIRRAVDIFERLYRNTGEQA